MPRILFIHQNFPAQFGGLARYLQDQGWEVLFATAAEIAPKDRVTRLNGLKVIGFAAHREPTEGVHRYARATEAAVLNGQGFAQVGVKLLRSGFVPDLVVAHSGWGSGAFAKAIWPGAKFVQYLEWWYGFPPREGDPREFREADKRPDAFDQRALSQANNLPAMLDFIAADAVIAPTRFQAGTFPAFLRGRAVTLHDGIDCEFFSPGARTPFETTEGRVIAPETPLVTYATRGMEPIRGFMEFMEALSKLQRRNPDVHAVIAGNPTVHYAGKLPPGDSYRKRALATWDFDHRRIHWVGRLPLPRYRDLLRASDCHVYPTRAFVLSWSLVEAMSVGCPLVVSDNGTTREPLPNDRFALHVDHYDTDALAGAMAQMLDDPEGARRRGMAARRRAVRHYDRVRLYPAHRDLFLQVLEDSPE